MSTSTPKPPLLKRILANPEYKYPLIIIPCYITFILLCIALKDRGYITKQICNLLVGCSNLIAICSNSWFTARNRFPTRYTLETLSLPQATPLTTQHTLHHPPSYWVNLCVLLSFILGVPFLLLLYQTFTPGTCPFLHLVYGLTPLALVFWLLHLYLTRHLGPALTLSPTGITQPRFLRSTRHIPWANITHCHITTYPPRYQSAPTHPGTITPPPTRCELFIATNPKPILTLRSHQLEPQDLQTLHTYLRTHFTHSEITNSPAATTSPKLSEPTGSNP